MNLLDGGHESDKFRTHNTTARVALAEGHAVDLSNCHLLLRAARHTATQTH